VLQVRRYGGKGGRIVQEPRYDELGPGGMSAGEGVAGQDIRAFTLNHKVHRRLEA
jgi:hypothetical protein